MNNKVLFILQGLDYLIDENFVGEVLKCSASDYISDRRSVKSSRLQRLIQNPLKTSKMETFAKIVSGLKPLLVLAKFSIESSE